MEAHATCMHAPRRQSALHAPHAPQVDDALLQRYASLLTPAEAAAAATAAAPAAARQRVLARALARATLARYAPGRPHPADLRFGANANGKPFLLGRHAWVLAAASGVEPGGGASSSNSRSGGSDVGSSSSGSWGEGGDATARSRGDVSAGCGGAGGDGGGSGGWRRLEFNLSHTASLLGERVPARLHRTPVATWRAPWTGVPGRAAAAWASTPAWGRGRPRPPQRNTLAAPSGRGARRAACRLSASAGPACGASTSPHPPTPTRSPPPPRHRCQRGAPCGPGRGGSGPRHGARRDAPRCAAAGARGGAAAGGCARRAAGRFFGGMGRLASSSGGASLRWTKAGGSAPTLPWPRPPTPFSPAHSSVPPRPRPCSRARPRAPRRALCSAMDPEGGVCQGAWHRHQRAAGAQRLRCQPVRHGRRSQRRGQWRRRRGAPGSSCLAARGHPASARLAAAHAGARARAARRGRRQGIRRRRRRRRRGLRPGVALARRGARRSAVRGPVRTPGWPQGHP